MTFRHSLTLVISILLAWNTAPAAPPVLGIVTEANRVHLNRGEASVGTTVYDGDHFSTETGGMVLLRGDAITLELPEESSALVRNKTSRGKGTEVELSAGTLIFTAMRTTALEVVFLEASICPSADTRTIAQVSITGPKELQIYARRGSLLFSYQGETKTILEGTAFRVILDPPEDHAKNGEARKAGQLHRAAIFIAIGAGAAGAAALFVQERHHHKPPESPDRP